MTGPADRFGLAELRRVVLDAWQASPRRFREDANAEEALYLGGYADRVLVELVANAVDAAAEAGVPARVRIELRRGPAGVQLRVANTGAALTADGVAALASLRASAKRDSVASVGRFGVGFTAVVGVSGSVEVLSAGGGVRFDEDAARAALHGRHPDLDREVRARDGRVPVLRLPFPSAAAPGDPVPAGYTTEVRLVLRPDAVAAVEAELAAVDEGLFWALPGLTEVVVVRPDAAGHRWALGPADEPADGPAAGRWPAAGAAQVDIVDGIPDGAAGRPAGAPSRRRQFRTVTAVGELDPGLLSGRPTEERGRTGWRITWVLPVPPLPPGSPGASTGTIGAPTPTDEPLTFPARLYGSFPVDESRRHLAPGAVLDVLVERAADAYVDLVLAEPAARRPGLVPASGFPRGPVDAGLRSAVLDRLRRTPFLLTAAGTPVAPVDAVVLDGLDRSPRGGADASGLLVAAVPGLLAPPARGDLSALRAVGVRTVPLAEATSALAALDRPAAFWAQLYAALGDADAEDLGDLPVPLLGGGRRFGARGCLLPGDLPAELLQRAHRVAPSLPVVDPAAAHPLLQRLGAAPVDAAGLAASPALVAAYRTFRDELEDADPDPDEVELLGRLALDLARAGAPASLGALASVVLTADGEPWPADELCLPGSRWAALLEPDDRPPPLDPQWLAEPPEVLAAVGVRDGVRVRTVTEPDDTVPDLDRWWSEVAGVGPVPADVPVVADLDLVADDAWPALLELLAGDRAAREALLHPPAPSYTGWYLARHAVVAGAPLRHWRTAAAAELAGLYDVLPLEIDPRVAAAAGVLTGPADAARDPEELLRRYADPDRRVPAAVVPALTAEVARLLAADADLELPDRARTVTGEAVDVDDCLVLDAPWLAGLLPAGVLVPSGADPDAVAAALDLEPASLAVPVTVRTAGAGPTVGDTPGDGPQPADPAAIAAAGAADPAGGGAAAGAADPAGAAAAAAAALGVPPALAARLHVHPALAVEPAGDDALDRWPEPDGRAVPVRWWVAGGDALVDGSPAGIGRAVAWLAGRWPDRDVAVAAATGDGTALAERAVAG
ncbi:sacsin N-terminal ATP-binding-like domain-containing protein [Nakamurella endophytica]|uniref:Molecular chaperone Hsp90 n=1 Tax=Nakamurella endophytica TaxID=1748367 RepID=A0A917WBJ5_9ACTN|nr:ATP-binding protein [Nakamurella endophytica]GGL88728.1 hypothetical protein GCM10011594_05430 [Nakamurella endophytica]